MRQEITRRDTQAGHRVCEEAKLSGSIWRVLEFLQAQFVGRISLSPVPPEDKAMLANPLLKAADSYGNAHQTPGEFNYGEHHSPERERLRRC